MRFRSNDTEPSPDYKPVNGVYLHGTVEDAAGYDCVDIAAADAEPFRLLVDDTDGIEGMRVELEGYPGETVLFAWKSAMGVPMVANPPFEMLHFRGLIVDTSDTKSLEFARQCFKENRKSL